MAQETRYWFPAKRYGLGWGLPCTWQGWVVLGLYAGLLMLGFSFFPAPGDRVSQVACTIALTVLLLAICYTKGEPLRWRWGSDD